MQAVCAGAYDVAVRSPKSLHKAAQRSRPRRTIEPRILSRAGAGSYSAVHLVLPFSEQDRWRAHPSLKGFCVFYAGWYVKASGHSWQRGNTNEGIYIYCTGGKGFYRCDGKEWPVSAGDLLYCAPFTTHSYGADARDPWTIYWMHVAGSEVSTYSSLLGFSRDRPVIRVGRRPSAVAMFRTVFQHLKPPLNEARMAILAGAGRLLLASMAKGNEAQAAADTIAVGVQRVAEAMESRIHEHPGIADWARIFGGSRSHFQRQFKHFTGHSPNEYFLRLKIQKASSLLAGTTMLVSEIASQLGFPDPFYFSRLFRRMTGCSARTYRALARRQPDPVGEETGPAAATRRER